MNDTNTFNEYRPLNLPYQRSGNDSMQATQSRGQQAFPQQQVPPTRTQRQPGPAKMPKAKALSLVRRLKQGVVVASLLSFGTFGALVVNHTVGTTTSQASTSTTTSTTKTTTSTPTSTSSSTSTPSSTSTSTSTTTPSSASSSTSSSTQGGSHGFGSSSTTSNPVSGTHTS